MKHVLKKLSTILLATTFMLGTQVLTFAELESNASNDPTVSDSSAENASGETAQDSASATDGFVEVPDADADEDETTEPTDDGALEEAPDTGAPIAVIVVVVIAIACVPIIFKTRK